MNVLRATAVVAGATTTMLGLLVPPAAAAPRPTGTTCGALTANDPGDLTYQFGYLFGGPLVLGDDTNPAVVYSGTVTCTLQVAGATHADADTCTATGATTGVVATVPPIPCSYPEPAAEQQVFVCTQVDLVGGTTLYWDSAGGTWSTSSAAQCDLATKVSAGTAAADGVGVLKELLDSVLCPVLRIVFPPEGDVGILWDCPPYATGPEPTLPSVATVVAAVPDVAA